MVCPLYRDCPLLRDSNCIILIGRLKFGDLVLSIVEIYLIQCPLFGVSVKRDSTVLPSALGVNPVRVSVNSFSCPNLMGCEIKILTKKTVFWVD